MEVKLLSFEVLKMGLDLGLLGLVKLLMGFKEGLVEKMVKLLIIKVASHGLAKMVYLGVLLVGKFRWVGLVGLHLEMVE